jgi:hypothetical protein
LRYTAYSEGTDRYKELAEVLQTEQGREEERSRRTLSWKVCWEGRRESSEGAPGRDKDIASDERRKARRSDMTIKNEEGTQRERERAKVCERDSGKEGYSSASRMTRIWLPPLT